MTDVSQARPVGQLLRSWRERRRLSQLELSHSVDVSTRHLSYLETGRAQPSRAMVLRLAEHLDVPLRDRNRLLLSAGFAPVYSEAGLHSPQLVAVRAALRGLLAGHEPNPGLVVDRWWNLVEANAPVHRMLATVDPELLRPPVNVLRLALHPDALASRCLNLPEFRSHLLHRLQRQVVATADPELVDLLAELRSYPGGGVALTVPMADEVVVTWQIDFEGQQLALLSTVATFGTPVDITVSELVIELFFPADPQTAEALRAMAEQGPGLAAAGLPVAGDRAVGDRSQPAR